MTRVRDSLLHPLLPGIRNAPQYSPSSRYGLPRRNVIVLMSATALVPLRILKKNQMVLREK
jgi:hypothetical protein